MRRVMQTPTGLIPDRFKPESTGCDLRDPRDNQLLFKTDPEGNILIFATWWLPENSGVAPVRIASPSNAEAAMETQQMFSRIKYFFGPEFHCSSAGMLLEIYGVRMKYYLIAILLGLLGLSGCGDVSPPTRENNFTPLTSIEISAGLSRIASSTSTQLRATGNFSGLFTRDITDDVIWSADTTVEIISNPSGTLFRAKGISAGDATISAELDGITASFTLNVSNATLNSLVIAPLQPETPKGFTTQFTATGTFSDGTTQTTQDITFDVVWASSDPLKATISNVIDTMGLASTVDVGATEISATFLGNPPASTTMTVSTATLSSMTLSPPAPSILALSSGQMTAEGSFSDATKRDITNDVTWTSSFPAIATISNQGLVTTLLDGFTTISATLAGKNANTQLSVTGGNLSVIEVLPADFSHIHITPVLTLQMTAQGIFPNAGRDISRVVTWSSSNLAVATIDSSGIVTTVGPGITEIKAVSGAITGTTPLSIATGTYLAGSLTIAPLTIPAPGIAVDTSQQFSASGSFSDNSIRDLTSIVSWGTSANTIATIGDLISDKGIATGVAAGSAIITASFGGNSVSANLTVTAPTLISVAIDSPQTSNLPGQSLQFTATATYLNAPAQDITADVIWSSADTSVAIFHDDLKAPGEILVVDSGNVTLSATFGGQTATLNFLVP